ncbi:MULTISPECIES: IS701 family transposase [unclassified Streptomyces]|uniref:IS701 family transposase n=1 Tax=unclassified Streptomyces TaxID=2593676 RepID=UPI0036BFB337
MGRNNLLAAYATTRGHALVDRELYLPKSWTDDFERCRAVRIPQHRRFATKDEPARTMVLRAFPAPLPVAWGAADAAYGQDSRFRRFLEDAGPSYVVAVPKPQQVHGLRIEHLIGRAPDEAWQRFSCGNSAKGPRLYDWAAAHLPAVWEFDGDEPTWQRRMLACRSITKRDELAYFLASALLDAIATDCVRIAGCRWKIEECFQSAKNECGLDQYEVRHYVGWYWHITRAMLAHAFLAVTAAQERQRKGGPTGALLGRAPRDELVEMAPSAPGPGRPLSLHTAWSSVRGAGRANPLRTRHHSAKIPTLKPLTRSYTEVWLECEDLSGRSCAEPDNEGCCGGGTEEDVAALFVSSGDGSGKLELADGPLDGSAFPVPLFVERGWPPAARRLSLCAGRRPGCESSPGSWA